MSESAISEFAKARGFNQRTLDRWLSWAPADRDAMKEIAIELKIGENHLRDIMDWLEEISLRDRGSIGEILARQAIIAIRTDPRLGRADKLKRIKEQLRRWRFPRLAAAEDAVRQRIHALKLPGAIRLTVPAGLEGGRLQVEFGALSAVELQAQADALRTAAATQLAAEIFDLLSGRKSIESGD